MRQQFWFVYDYYIFSGRPKAEDAVLCYAREKYLYCLVADYMLEDIVMDLERYCLELHEKNRRLAPVKITITAERSRNEDGMAILHIGQQFLRIRLVKKTIE